MKFSNPSRGSLTCRAVACLGTLLILLPLFGFFAEQARAQTNDTDEVVIFVLDLSGSMNEPFDASQTKLDVAKAAFIEAFANVSPDARVGLRTYGDQIAATAPAGREASCTTDTRLATPVAPLQRDQIISQVQGFTALGDTPIGLAIQQASNDIPPGSTGTIVLFSDGRDECFDADLDGDPAIGPSFGQDPCEIAKAITSGDGAVDRIVTVGFRADSAAETELRCIADSTGGTYTAIETPEDARDALPTLLVQLSAPREAQRLIGREIQGATSTDDAPDLVRLDEAGADKVLYTDSIDMNSLRIYRMPEYGPAGGTFTATVFGLPPELGITLDMRIYVPKLDQRFFQGQFADVDAGLPARPTASIRCTDCQITGGPHEAFFVVSLNSDTTIVGTYELELLTEGPGFGGPTTSCSAPQACFYPQEILNLTAELEAARSALNNDVGELAPPALIAERDQLRIDTGDEQDAVDAANARALELEERIPLAPSKSNSFRLPLVMILGGIGLALVPAQKLRRPPKDAEEDDDAESEAESATGVDGIPAASNDAQAPVSEPAAAPTERGRPSLDDVGPAPAISPNRTPEGNSWDDELEAAKAALAKHRPDRPGSPAPASTTEAASPPVVAESAPAAAETVAPPAPAPAPQPAAPPRGQFTPEQHAAAQAAAEKIAAQRSAESAAASEAGDTPTVAPHAGSASEAPAIEAPATTPEQIAGSQPNENAAADQAAADQAAAQRAAAEQAAQETAERAAAERAAAEQAAQETAERAAADQAAREAAERAAADQAAQETAERAAAERAAADQAAQEAAERAAADQAAIEQAQQAAKAAADHAATEQQAAEQAARDAAERAAAAQLAREVAERAAADQAAQAAAAQAAADQAARDAAARAAAEKVEAERLAAEQAAREAAEKAAAEQAAREAAERLAAEQAAAERVAREAAEKAAAEKAEAERLAAEQAAREAAEREAAEKAAAEQAAREAAAREAAEKAAAEQAAREAAEREAAEKAAAEQAAREAAERAAAEKAAREAAENLAAEKAAAERAAAERLAAEEAARAAAEQAAADRAAAEKAAAERVAAEQAAAEAAARAVADKAAAEKAASDRVAAEQAAAEATAQRAVAEAAALKAATDRAEEEAAAQAALQAAAATTSLDSDEAASPLTEEERRDEARSRMLAKQNIVASSSSSPTGATAPSTADSTAGTSSLVRPPNVQPAATTASPASQGPPQAAGWYEDQAIVGQFRWWDGSTWTGYTAPTDQEPAPS